MGDIPATYQSVFVLYENINEQWVITLQEEPKFIADMKNEGYNMDMDSDECDFNRDVVRGPLLITARQPDIDHGVL